MNLDALAIELPHVSAHPNRVPFRGVLTTVDRASDRPPAGSRGHRVLLTKAAAEHALPSLIGMALDYTPNFDGHDSRHKAGIITSAEVVGDKLLVAGYIFARDFPELMRELRANRGKLGMSYELADARVRDVRSPIWTLDEATFTGAAILLKKKAAYENTSIELAAKKSDIAWETAMTQKQSEELIHVTQRMVSAAEALSESISRLNAQHEELSVRVEKIVAALETGSGEDDSEAAVLKSRIAELESANADLREKAAKLNTATISANGRKTLPPLVSSLLAKSGVEVSDPMDAALDAAMTPLSIEQRIAVKSQMAKAGLIG